MKIYFGFTVAGDRSGIHTARQVVQLLEHLGHQVAEVEHRVSLLTSGNTHENCTLMPYTNVEELEIFIAALTKNNEQALSPVSGSARLLQP